MKPAQCLAVMYHYVRDRSDTPDAAIRGLSPDRFIAQIDQLCREMEPIDWTAFDAWKSRRGPVPSRCFLLTFDDALRDHAEVVAPILHARGLRGVFFVSAGPLATGRLASAHIVHLLLARLGADRLNRAVRDWLDARPASDIACANDHDAIRMYHYESPEVARLKYMLARSVPRHLRRIMLDELLDRFIPQHRSTHRNWYVDLPELEELQAAGHTIGGHGYAHELYSNMSADQRRKDIERSARFLQDGLGERRRPFSYPFGDFDDEIIGLIHDSGFVHGFTTQRQWIRRGSDDYRLGRCDTIHVDQFLGEEVMCPSQ